MKQRCPVHRRPLGGVPVRGAGRGEREDVGDVERAREEIRIAPEVRFEQIHAPAMERHHRRVRRLEAVLDIHLQNAMLGGRVPAVGPEEVLHGVPVHALRPNDAGTERKEDRGPIHAQRVRGTGERPLLERRLPRQFVDHAHRVGFALERGASGRRLEVLRTVAVKEADDAIAPQIRRVRHRRTPVAVGANQDVLVDERRIPCDERADGVEVVAPDRIRELHRVDEPRPARSLVAACEHQLRVGKLRGSGVTRLGLMFAPLADRIRLAGMEGAEEFLGLTMKLLEVGAEPPG